MNSGNNNMAIDEKDEQGAEELLPLRQARQRAVLIAPALIVFMATVGLLWWFKPGVRQVRPVTGESIKRVPPAKPVPGQAFIVKSHSEDVIIKARGVVKAVKPVPVNSPAAGRVIAIPSTAGSRVTTASILINLDPAPLQAAADQAKARYDLAQTQLDKTGLTPGIPAAELKIAQLNTEIARRDWEAAANDLNNSIIKAPISGVLDSLNVAQGQTLAKNETIGTIVEENGYVIEAWADHGDAAALRIDATGTAMFASRPHEKFTVRATSIGLPADSGSRQSPVSTDPTLVPFLLKLENGTLNWLRAGLHGIELEIPAAKTVFSVPKNTVVRRGGKSVVYVIHGKRRLAKEVVVGRTTEDSVEVIEGISENEALYLNR